MGIEKNKQIFSEDQEDQNEKERLLNEFNQQMEMYQRITKKVRALDERYPPNVRSRTISSEIIEADKERHQNHLKLIEIAGKLKKSKEDVLVDIIRWENSLEEYGLPEFSILTDSDIVNTGGFHSAIQFNIDENTGKPVDKVSDHDSFSEGSFYDELTRVLQEDEILLVFSINPIEDYGEDEIAPEDFKERKKRAVDLADEIGGEYFDNVQGGYHETSAHIIGVVFPKKDLEKIAGIIRSDPQKFRLGNEFYTSGR